MNAHPAASSDHWSPGFAKRAENFSRVSEAARAWRWEPGQYVARIVSAISKGTPGLTGAERALLMYYADHLNQDQLEQNQAFIWPSISLTAREQGVTARQVRRINNTLEAQGWLIRDYNHANRPAAREAFNLAPLLARLGELDKTRASNRQAEDERRAAYLQSVLSNIPAQADIDGHLEQSNSNQTDSVTGPGAPTARNLPNSRRATPARETDTKKNLPAPQSIRTRQYGSPGRASFFGAESSDATSQAERVREELAMALQACPELGEYVSAEVLRNPLSAAPEDGARIAAAAEALLPEAERNNGKTALWGFRRHGARIAVMLAVALKDRQVQNPARYFGRFASSDRSGSLDLRHNLTRILRDTSRVEDPPAAPKPTPADPATTFMAGRGADDPIWMAIDAHLRRLVRTGAYGSWFSRLGFLGIQDGVLTLLAPGATAAQRLKNDHLRDILAAAEAAGHRVQKVVIVTKSATPPTDRSHLLDPDGRR
ncbi:MAG: helix-turn-helix domain-containing protein [Caulobacteraceae bacterium]